MAFSGSEPAAWPAFPQRNYLGIDLLRRQSIFRCCNAAIERNWAITPVPRIISRRGAGAESTILLHDLSADLANRRVLIAGATAATDRADQLAAFDQRKS